MRSKIYLDLDQNNQLELVINSVISDDIRDKSVNNFFNKLHSCSGNNLSFLYQSLKETKDFPAHQQIKISPTAKELYFPNLINSASNGFRQKRHRHSESRQKTVFERNKLTLNV